MTINLQTLKCGECGSGVLVRRGMNEYVCQHCGSVSLVEDNVSERLDRVLEQVKDEAARRLAQEQSHRQAAGRQSFARVGLGALVAAGVAVLAVTLLMDRGRSRPVARAPAAAAWTERAIPLDSLQLGEPRQVLVGGGSSGRPKLLVTVRNQGDQPLERPAVKAVLYDGADKLGERNESAPIGVLMPGESAPLLIDLPGDRNVTRQELSVQRLSAPSRSTDGPSLRFERVRLAQQGDTVRLVGRIANTRTDAALAGCETLVTLYDDAGGVIGFGRGYAPASELKPGERTVLDVRIERFGNRQAPIAAWDYRIDYRVMNGEQQGRTQVVSRDRVIRTAGGPERFNPELRLSGEELLADERERFDLAQLEMLPLIAARNTIQQPVYLTEIVNRSADAIALAPGLVISQFDGNQLDGATAVAGPAALYPGERFPVRIEPRRADRITQTRAEWKPLRRAALPGHRAPLEVQVTGTRADTSSVLVNFSRRYTYKFAEVSGQVRNGGPGIVRKPVLWVSLRDREGRLTGFSKVENLPAIGPGDSVPFQVKVDQLGRDFASVTTLYQAE